MKSLETKKSVDNFADLEKLMDEDGETLCDEEFEENYEADLSYINSRSE